MSAENCLIRSSGLVVPAMGLAGKWKFEACADCCESQEFDVCGDCYTGSATRLNTDWPVLANDSCDNCADYSFLGGITIDPRPCVRSSTGNWPGEPVPISCGSHYTCGFNQCTHTYRTGIDIRGTKCFLTAQLTIPDSVGDPIDSHLWELEIFAPFSVINHMLPYLSTGTGNTLCDGTGTTVHMFE